MASRSARSAAALTLPTYLGRTSAGGGRHRRLPALVLAVGACCLLILGLTATRTTDWGTSAQVRWKKRAHLWKDAQSWLGSISAPEGYSLWKGSDSARWMGEMLGLHSGSGPSKGPSLWTESRNDSVAAAVGSSVFSAGTAPSLSVAGVRTPVPVPTCKRTMLYNLAGAHGFASEFGVYLRLAAIAQHFQYALLVDDTAWNYGKLSDYFEPPRLACRPSPAWHTISRTKAGRGYRTQSLEDALGEPTRLWVAENHVFAPRDLEYFDALFLRIYVNEKALDLLHHRELEAAAPPLPLAGELVVPKVFYKAFRAQAHSLSRIYRPNAGMRREIAKMEADLGWTGAEHSATDQITVAMHMRCASACASRRTCWMTDCPHVRNDRLGDKALELDRFGPQAFAPKGWQRPVDQSPTSGSATTKHGTDLDRDRVALYIEAADSIYEDIVKESGADKERKPRLLVMTDDPGAVKRIFREVNAERWDVVVTGRTVSEPADKRRLTRRWRKSKDRHAPEGGFHEGVFNALPAKDRVKEARAFLRDLTVLGRRADGLVFTGSSNVSRIFALLAGADRTLANGARRFRSLDVRWHPTARYV